MKFKHALAALLLSLFSVGAVHAGGSAVNEDLSLLISIADDLISIGKKEDAEGFTRLAKAAINLTSENWNNSMVLSRVGTKLSSAKRAVNTGNFDKGIEIVQQAKDLMMEKRELTWDGGS